MIEETKQESNAVKKDFTLQNFSIQGTFEHSMGIFVEGSQLSQDNQTFEEVHKEYIDQNDYLVELKQTNDENDIIVTDDLVIWDTDNVNEDKQLNNETNTGIPIANNNHKVESNTSIAFEKNISNGEVNPAFEVIVIDAEGHKTVSEVPYESVKEEAVLVVHTNDSTEAKPSDEDVSRVRLTLIAIGSFVMYFCSWGMAQSFGVMFIALLKRFGGNRSETTWVESLFSGILLVSGIC